jgi:hypothetical protein
MTESSYMERTLTSIKTQCSVRGIPPEEIESVLAHIKAKVGKPVEKMSSRQLRNLNRDLPHVMVDYLGGKKRRPMVRKRRGQGAGASGSMEVITPEDVGPIDASELAGE